MGSGDDYEKINKVISIIITDEKLIKDSERYHHRFTFYDPDAEVEFTDLIEIHTVELKKLPDDSDGTQLYDWARFIAAETEEEFEMAAQANPQVRRAVVKLRELSADEKARDMVECHEKGERDLECSLIPAYAACTLTLNKTNYAQGETITATVTCVTEQMVSDDAIISIYRAGAATMMTRV